MQTPAIKNVLSEHDPRIRVMVMVRSPSMVVVMVRAGPFPLVDAREGSKLRRNEIVRHFVWGGAAKGLFNSVKF